MTKCPYFLWIFIVQVVVIKCQNNDVNVSNTENSIRLQWEAAITDVNFTVTYGTFENMTSENIIYNGSDSDTVFNINDLTPGETYLVKLFRNDVNFFTTQVTTKPLPPFNLTISEAGMYNLYIQWQPAQESVQDYYRVFITGVTNFSEVFDSENLTDLYYNATGLKPGHEYTITVLSGSKNSLSNYTSIITDNTVPATPILEWVSAIDNTTLMLRWSLDPESEQDENQTLSVSYVDVPDLIKKSLTCRMVLSDICVVKVPMKPGQVGIFNLSSTQGQRRSPPLIFMYNAKPNPVTAITELGANTTSLEIQFVPPTNSVYGFILVQYYVDDVEVGNDSSPTPHVVLENLDPGTDYKISITLTSMFENSDSFNKTLYTYPVAPQSINLLESDISHTQVEFSWDPVDSGKVDYYQTDIYPREPKTNQPTRDFSVEKRIGMFENLVPGKQYTLSVVSGSGTKESQPVNLTFWTKPYPPSNLTAVLVSGRVITVVWSPPTDGLVESYLVQLESVTPNASDHTHEHEHVNSSVMGTSYSFTRLHPGETYTISVAALSGNMTSDSRSLVLTTNPSSVADLYVDYVGTDTVNVSWPRPEGTVFTAFRLEIDPPHAQSPINIDNSLGILDYSFTGLNPGTLYNISIQTIANGSSSDQAWAPVLTDPLPISQLNISSHDTSRLYLEWEIDDWTQQSHFEVVYHSIHEFANESAPDVQVDNGTTIYHLALTGLSPGHMYTVSIRCVQNIGGMTTYSQWFSSNKSTKPKMVVNLTSIYDPLKRELSLSWQPGSDSIQDSYYVWYRGMNAKSHSGWNQTLSQKTEIILNTLFPGEIYELLVYAVSYDEMSPHAMTKTQINPLAPDDLTLNQTSVTSKSFQFSWTYKAQDTYVQLYRVVYEGFTYAEKTVEILPNISDSLIMTLNNLPSGEPFKVKVIAVVSGTTSVSSADLNVTLVPECLANVSEGPMNTSKSEIHLQYTEESNYFDYYEFKIINSTSSSIRKNKDDLDRSLSLGSLEAGTQYMIRILTVSGDKVSEPKYDVFQTAPNTPQVTQVSSANEIYLTLHRPSGHVDNYNVICYTIPSSSSDSPQECGSHSVMVSKDEHIVNFTNLNPYTEYKFKVIAIAYLKHSQLEVRIKTSQAAPSSVQDLKALEVSPLTVNLTWKPPSTINGILSSYMIHYSTDDNLSPVESDSRDITGGKVNQLQFNEQFANLLAGRTYRFTVSARTTDMGQASSTAITLRTYAPPITNSAVATPKVSIDSSVPKVTPSSVIVNFTYAFSEKYGSIINYTVIVTTDTSVDTTKYSLPGWKAAQNDPTIKAYQAIANCSDFFTKDSTCDGKFTLHKQGDGYKVFEIGSEGNCNSKFYCNGPLKSQTNYYVKLRAYTTMGFSDTGYSPQLQTTFVEEKSGVGGIVGGVIGGLALIGIVFLVLFVIRRKMTMRSNMYKGNTSHIMTPRSSFRHPVKSHAVNVCDFKEHIVAMAADSDFKYAEEFEDLKEIGRDQACSAAELPVNRGKNRFTNILPYDHSRVKLLPTDDEEGSDYINANYMPGYTSRREYIVTQGPLPSTRDDFWRMIWEQNIRNIVMLTKCIEKGREKCDHYWPSGSDAMFYGDLQVATLNETKFPSWVITEFKVSMGDITRQVRHFHFTAWPDFGVPEKPQTLVKFVRLVRDRLHRECGPVLVHCSAGVGRSGTFIALDRLLQHVKEHDVVDIFQIVADMRKERVWMVQTEQQYVCIHQCLLCVLDGKEEEHVYENAAFANAAYDDDEGINIEIS